MSTNKSGIKVAIIQKDYKNIGKIGKITTTVLKCHVPE